MRGYLTIPAALVAFAVCAAGQASRAQQGPPGVPDLRGIWRAPASAYVNLEAHPIQNGHPAGTSVVVDPPDGKIPYLPGALARKQQNFAGRATADPGVRCFQPGVPRATYLPTPFQIFQNAGGVYIIYQNVHAYRIIHLDGSPHNQGLAYAMGDSRGRWEGRTLVADVTSFSGETWFDMAGNYHSEALHVVERYTRTNRTTMLYEATVEDPNVFARPWTIRIPLHLETTPGFELSEDECEEDTQGRHHVSRVQEGR